MLLVGVLEGITCDSFLDAASLLLSFSSSCCWSWSYSFFFFPTVLSIVPLVKLFSREEKILLGN